MATHPNNVPAPPRYVGGPDSFGVFCVNFPLLRKATEFFALFANFPGRFAGAGAPLISKSKGCPTVHIFEKRCGIDAGAPDLSNDARVGT